MQPASRGQIATKRAKFEPAVGAFQSRPKDETHSSGVSKSNIGLVGATMVMSAANVMQYMGGNFMGDQ